MAAGGPEPGPQLRHAFVGHHRRKYPQRIAPPQPFEQDVGGLIEHDTVSLTTEWAGGASICLQKLCSSEVADRDCPPHSPAQPEATTEDGATQKCDQVETEFLPVREEKQEENIISTMATGRSFLSFPAEIRNMIYEYSLHWPTSDELYAPFNKAVDEYYRRRRYGAPQEFPQWTRTLKAPTIILLCHQITAECLPILQSRTFVISKLPPWIPNTRYPMMVTEFISRRTIQNLRHIEIRLQLGLGRLGSGWAWVKVFKDLMEILKERNRFKHFHVFVSMSNTNILNLWDDENRHLEEIMDLVDRLRENNVGNKFTPGKVTEEYWRVKGHKAAREVLDKTVSAPPVRRENTQTKESGPVACLNLFSI